MIVFFTDALIRINFSKSSVVKLTVDQLTDKNEKRCSIWDQTWFSRQQICPFPLLLLTSVAAQTVCSSDTEHRLNTLPVCLCDNWIARWEKRIGVKGHKSPLNLNPKVFDLGERQCWLLCCVLSLSSSGWSIGQSREDRIESSNLYCLLSSGY